MITKFRVGRDLRESYLVLEGPLKRSFINRGSINASKPRKVFHLPRMLFSRDGKRQI